VKVWYSFPHPIGAPGIATVAWHQVRGLAARGVEVVCWAAAVARPLPPDVEVHTTLTVVGRRVPPRLVGVGRAWSWHDRRVAAALRRTAHPPDLVHTWPAACLATLGAARARRLPGVREAPSAHTAEAFAQAAREQERTGVVLPPGHPFRADQARLAREEEEFAAADALLVPSAAAAATYRARGIAPAQVVEHRYGCDLSVYHPGASWTPPPAGALRVAYVGRIEPTKGVHDALEAWVRSGVGGRGGRFVLVGEAVAGMERVLGRYRGAPGVEVRPFTDDVAAVLRDVDALVLASVTEGSALVTYEAQACGCVLLVSDAAGADCRPDLDAFVYPARDVDRLAAALRRLADDPDLLVRMRHAVLARRERLGWDAAADRLLDRYREVVARARTAGRRPPISGEGRE